MNLMRIGIVIVLLAIPAGLTAAWIRSADARLAEMSTTATSAEAPAVAAAADVAYCSPQLKKILRRVPPGSLTFPRLLRILPKCWPTSPMLPGFLWPSVPRFTSAFSN